MKKWTLALLMLWLFAGICAAEEFTDFSSLYPDKFLPEGSEPIRTENSYQSEDVNLVITG